MIALVPVKGFRNSKTRLSSVLDEEARSRLTFWMMARVLKTLSAARTVKRILLVSQDVDVQSAGWSMGVESFCGTSQGLNGAILEAVESLKRSPSEGALIIPADLPLLRVKDVDSLVEVSFTESPCVVSSPSRRRDGTNALLLDPPNVISPAYGPDSFARHQRQANAKGVPFHIYTAPSFSLDIDLPEDFEVLQDSLDAATRKRLSFILSSGSVVPSS
jgi:2-phospho-L-lactate guanylyltransferase